MKFGFVRFVQWLLSILVLASTSCNNYCALSFTFPSFSKKHTTLVFSSSSSSSEEATNDSQITQEENASVLPTTAVVPTTSSSSSSNTDGDFSFFDEASIYVRAGSGGQGSSTYKKAKKGANGIPDGGTGGKGGNIVLILDSSLNTLAGLSRRTLRPNAFGGGGAAASSKRMGHSNKQGSDIDNNDNNNFVVRERLLSFRAEDGTAGGRMYNNGCAGEDCEVRVPPGTVVKLEVTRIENNFNDDDESYNDGDDNESNSDTSNDHNHDDEGPAPEYEVMEIGTVSDDNPTLLVARGGKGGEGTATLKGKKKGATRRGPEGGERCRLRLTLKIVADIALVGVPNAGKSTFLGAVTRAKPRIADYPFTTVIPNLGTWIPGDIGGGTNTNANNRDEGKGKDKDRAAGSNGLVLCDVPGLIAGASEGVGLGHAFLRHIERCRVILHLVDATGDDPVGDLAMVNDELKRYGTGSLAEKPQVVIVNKIDAAWDELDIKEDVKSTREKLATKLKKEMGHTRLMWVSAKEREGVDDLMIRMASYVGKIKEEEGNKAIL